MMPEPNEPSAPLPVEPSPADRVLRHELETTGRIIQARNGQTYHVRTIRADDASAIMRGYDALTDEQKWLRVLHVLPHLTADMADRFTHPDPNTSVAVVIEGSGDLAGELVCSARVANVQHGSMAEFSVTVRPEVAGQGLARQALSLVIEAAREAGSRGVWGTISIRNTRMLGLAKRLGMQVRRDPDDAAQMIAELSFDSTAAPARP